MDEKLAVYTETTDYAAFAMLVDRNLNASEKTSSNYSKTNSD